MNGMVGSEDGELEVKLLFQRTSKVKIVVEDSAITLYPLYYRVIKNEVSPHKTMA